MSRGVKDLRELVVVSRLSYRDSDSESDDGRSGMITPFESLVINDSCGDARKRTPVSSPTPPSSADSGLGKRKRKKRKKPKGYVSSSSQPPSITRLHEFPRGKPLPSVKTNADRITSASSSSGESLGNHALSDATRTDFTSVLDYLDEQIVAHWLERANEHLKELTLWCTDLNFVLFAQFWITEFSVDKRCEILALEHSILLDELTLAFREGLELQKVQQKDLLDLLSALLREYPRRLTMSSGVYLFLDYLEVFTSERTTEYRHILSDVKLSTTNKKHVQLILASRCFMLINVWVAIVNFYRQLATNPALSSDHLNTHRDKQEISQCRLTVAINLGLTEVVHYFLFSGKCSAGYVDSRQKTLLHVATASGQPRVVEYLLKKWTGCIDVNRPCDTGNSPLHVAVNLGNSRIVQLLLSMPDINVNIKNKECEDTTPLHLAVIHGHTEIVNMLLKHGADVTIVTNQQTALQLAKDFDHNDIVDLLISASDIS